MNFHPSSFPFIPRRRAAGTRPLTRGNAWVLPLTGAAGCGKQSGRRTGGVSKQQVTALGGTAGAGLPSSTGGTKGAGNAVGWGEQGDPVPCPPPHTSSARMGCKQLGSRLKERGFGVAWHGVNPWTCRLQGHAEAGCL